jgi:hypothetical protein
LPPILTDKEIGMSEVPGQGSIGRSILSVVAGFIAVVVLSLGTDILLHYVAGFPKLGQIYSDPQFLWATIYRTVYGVVGSYITAALAPRRPMKHALIGGCIGLVFAGLGVVASIVAGPKMGPLWYPVALFVGVLPTAWLGGQIRVMQTGPR